MTSLGRPFHPARPVEGSRPQGVPAPDQRNRTDSYRWDALPKPGPSVPRPVLPDWAARHPRRRRWIPALLIPAVIAAGGCSAAQSEGSAAGFSFVSPGGQTEITYAASARQPIGELSGPDLVGTGTVGLSDFPGKVIVINFWGSWCPPCRAEADGLNLAASTLAPKGVQFLGVDIKDNRQAGADFHAAKRVPYPSIFDPTMQTLMSLRGYPATAIPSTLVLDRRRRVSHVWLRPVSPAEIVAVVGPIAAERP